MELVSAVVSTYNRPVEIVLRAVKSIKQQTYENIEIIVVNDCPTNLELVQELGSRLEALDNRIQYIVHETNRGACAARNTGLAKAKGKYIAFLDDDDEWMPDKIEKQVSEMSDGIGLVYCDSIRIYGDKTFAYRQGRPGRKPIEKILKYNYIGGTSFPLMNTEYLRNEGGFDENIPSCQDYDVWIRMISKYGIKYIEQPLGYYYLSNDSTFKKNNKKYVQGNEYLLGKYKALFERYPSSYIYHINNMAYNGKYVLKDQEVYVYYKKKISDSGILSVYSLCMPMVKVINKILCKMHLD